MAPTVDYFSFGGTIASIPFDESGAARPSLTASDILASVPAVSAVANVEPHQIENVGSSELTLERLNSLCERLGSAVDAGASGVVVTQGTDTIEETSFILDLLWDRDAPIVITGAMRHPGASGPDGAANLLAAVQTAVSLDARGLGALVVMNDEVHAARFVRKMHTSSTGAFSSRPYGPLGHISEGRVVIPLRPRHRPHLTLRDSPRQPRVAIVRSGVGDDLEVLRSLHRMDYEGVVLEGAGGGHVSRNSLEAVRQVVSQMPVVLASRTGGGEVLTSTYSLPGCESELLELGLIRAGALDGLKARALLCICLSANLNRVGIAEQFRRVGLTNGITAMGQQV